MKPYLEPRFLGCLLLHAPATRLAWSLVERFETPYPLNRLHGVQMEGTLIKNSGAPDEHQRRVAAEALTLWRYYWVENVFDLELPDWELGLRHALQLQRQVGRQIAGATACVHVGLARVSGATHFLSFEPKSREAAQLFGLEVLPERL